MKRLAALAAALAVAAGALAASAKAMDAPPNPGQDAPPAYVQLVSAPPSAALVAPEDDGDDEGEQKKKQGWRRRAGAFLRAAARVAVKLLLALPLLALRALAAVLCGLLGGPLAAAAFLLAVLATALVLMLLMARLRVSLAPGACYQQYFTPVHTGWALLTAFALEGGDRLLLVLWGAESPARAVPAALLAAGGTVFLWHRTLAPAGGRYWPRLYQLCRCRRAVWLAVFAPAMGAAQWAVLGLMDGPHMPVFARQGVCAVCLYAVCAAGTRALYLYCRPAGTAPAPAAGQQGGAADGTLLPAQIFRP